MGYSLSQHALPINRFSTAIDWPQYQADGDEHSRDHGRCRAVPLDKGVQDYAVPSIRSDKVGRLPSEPSMPELCDSPMLSAAFAPPEKHPERAGEQAEAGRFGNILTDIVCSRCYG